MSTNPAALAVDQPARPGDWALWRDQAMAVLRLDLRTNFLTLRGFWIYFLAFAPTLIVGAHALSVWLGFSQCDIDEDTTILAGIMQLYYLHLGVYFGCMGIFTKLFRGEIVARTLHYYFLSPMRREVLVIGKFAAGLITAVCFFGAAVLACFVLMYAHFGAAGTNFVFHGPGLGHLGAYLGATTLACVGYGSLFLAMGMIFRNPILPAILILGWESINHILPAWLKKLSFVFYLQPLYPIDVPAQGVLAMFTVGADPAPVYFAVPGLLILSALLLAFSCWKVRSLEISYSSD